MCVPDDVRELFVVQLVERRIHPQERRDVHGREYRIDLVAGNGARGEGVSSRDRDARRRP